MLKKLVLGFGRRGVAPKAIATALYFSIGRCGVVLQILGIKYVGVPFRFDLLRRDAVLYPTA